MAPLKLLYLSVVLLEVFLVGCLCGIWYQHRSTVRMMRKTFEDTQARLHFI